MNVITAKCLRCLLSRNISNACEEKMFFSLIYLKGVFQPQWKTDNVGQFEHHQRVSQVYMTEGKRFLMVHLSRQLLGSIPGLPYHLNCYWKNSGE